MKIAVYCASSVAVAPENLALGFDLGAQIAKEGHELVWGGGAISVMGEVAKGARHHGGKTIGVIPERLMNIEFIDHDSTHFQIQRLQDHFLGTKCSIGRFDSSAPKIRGG